MAAFLWWRAYADFADSVRIADHFRIRPNTRAIFGGLSAKRVTNVCAAFCQGRFFWRAQIGCEWKSRPSWAWHEER